MKSALLLFLFAAALTRIEDAGAGAKVSRAQVAEMLGELQRFVAGEQK